MHFGLAVFCSTFILMHSFGEKNLNNHFFGKKKVSKVQIFNVVLVKMFTNRYARLKNPLTIEIFFESDFFTLKKNKHAFYEKFENHETHQLKINVCAFFFILA